MVERLNGIEKVRGSTPLISTIIEMRFARMKQGLNAFFVLTDSSFIPWKILRHLQNLYEFGGINNGSKTLNQVAEMAHRLEEAGGDKKRRPADEIRHAYGN